MLTLKLPEDLENRLNNLAKKTHRPKSFYMREALEEYLEEYEDAFLALDRLNAKNAKYLSTQEMEKRLGL
ncbi:MAG: ribbon-helix-helix domain-containing protein [Nitrospiraceae bacterium]|nr:ribbon-helix-helix domain-containing protein [Nitrospiraceae bacterium]